MFGSWITIAGGSAVLTMFSLGGVSDDQLAGGYAIVGLQGMAFIGVAAVRGALCLWRERKVIAQIIRESCE
jgi:hypothetical protein